MESLVVLALELGKTPEEARALLFAAAAKLEEDTWEKSAFFGPDDLEKPFSRVDFKTINPSNPPDKDLFGKWLMKQYIPKIQLDPGLAGAGSGDGGDGVCPDGQRYEAKTVSASGTSWRIRWNLQHNVVYFCVLWRQGVDLNGRRSISRAIEDVDRIVIFDSEELNINPDFWERHLRELSLPASKMSETDVTDFKRVKAPRVRKWHDQLKMLHCLLIDTEPSPEPARKLETCCDKE